MVIKTISIPKPSKREAESEAGDVIDLGAPRRSRRAAPARPKPRAPRPRPPYTPNPRLYPGPRPKPKPRPKRAEARGGDGRARHHRRVLRRPVPNARLYRPAPPRPAPPPAWPRATWPPPAPPARLDTASRAALRLSEQRRAGRAPHEPPRAARSPARAPPAPAARRLVVTLPAPPADPAPRYRPASDHFRLRSLDTDSGSSTPLAGRPAARSPRPAPAPAMDADNRHSTSPEDCSEGNETLSAPSEFLAEFLSAIMRRQYAEALKYCRLILQYEPHNATARGFFPLLQHKVAARCASPRDSSSEDASTRPPRPAAPDPHKVELMEQGADSSRSASRSSSRSRGSCASQSSLELDSSGSAPPSRSDSASGAAAGASSASEPDDNGNARPDTAHALACARDSAAELRRLRAHFTCSIK